MMKSISTNVSAVSILVFFIALSTADWLTVKAQNPVSDEAKVADVKDNPENTSENKVESSTERNSDNNATKPVVEKKTYSEGAVKHYNRAVELHQSGYLNPAIAEYKAAIEADDRMEEAYSNLGVIYAAQRSYAKAMEAFNKALSLKPSRPTTLNGLGSVLYAKGKVEEAKEKWRQAIAADPTFASAYYNIGNAFEVQKDKTAAISSYAKAIEVNPSMADAYFRIGNIYSKEKHPAQAKLLLTKAIELNPDADFAKEARKELSQIEVQLNQESDDKGVKMNVITPAGDRVPALSKPSMDEASLGSNTSLAVEKTKPDDGDEPKQTRGAFSLFKRKAKPAKKIDMFVQPQETPPGLPVEDLKVNPGK